MNIFARRSVLLTLFLCIPVGAMEQQQEENNQADTPENNTELALSDKKVSSWWWKPRKFALATIWLAGGTVYGMQFCKTYYSLLSSGSLDDSLDIVALGWGTAECLKNVLRVVANQPKEYNLQQAIIDFPGAVLLARTGGTLVASSCSPFPNSPLFDPKLALGAAVGLSEMVFGGIEAGRTLAYNAIAGVTWSNAIDEKNAIEDAKKQN